MENNSVVPTNSAEVRQMASMLKQAPEIEHKLNYYKEILKNNSEFISNIEKEIEVGVDIFSFNFFGISISITKSLTDYYKSKLLIEKTEAENQLFYQKQWFEDWLKRKNEYEVFNEKLSAEANEHFEETLEKAKIVAEKNIRLQHAIEKYLNDDNDQYVKNQFFLLMKKEIQNRKEYGNIKK